MTDFGTLYKSMTKQNYYLHLVIYLFTEIFRLVKADQPHGTVISPIHWHIHSHIDSHPVSQLSVNVSSFDFFNILEHSKTL